MIRFSCIEHHNDSFLMSRTSEWSPTRRQLSCPPGERNHECRNVRIQGRMQLFRKKSQKALNHVLALPSYSTGPGLLISTEMIDLQNNRVCKQLQH